METKFTFLLYDVIVTRAYAEGCFNVDINELTNDMLKQEFDKWQTTYELDALRNLYVAFDRYERQPTGQEIYLFLQNCVIQRLDHLREAAGIPSHQSQSPNRRINLHLLSKDFATREVTLQSWSALYHRYFLELPIPKNELTHKLEDNDLVTARTFDKRLDDGLKLLALELQRLEQVALDRRAGLPQIVNLPTASYGNVVGIDLLCEKVISSLIRLAGYPVVGIVGVGGIGKTTVAHRVIRTIDEDYKGFWRRIIWIDVNQELSSSAHHAQIDPEKLLGDVVTQLASGVQYISAERKSVHAKLEAMQERLQRTPHLIVLNNVEEHAELQVLLPALLPLTNIDARIDETGARTRMLVTSRAAIDDFSFADNFSVPPLDELNAKRLIMIEFDRLRKMQLLDDKQLTMVYDAVGGLPLALKLIASQIAYAIPLEEALNGLKSARHQDQTEYSRMYTRIYARTWKRLSKQARMLLYKMALIPTEGASWKYLHKTTALDHMFETTFKELQRFSLIETNIQNGSEMFSLHRLTITFLQTAFSMGLGPQGKGA